MLDISYIRDHAEEVKRNCANRHVTVDIDRLLTLDSRRRTMQQDADALRAKRHAGSKTKPTPEEIAAMRALGDGIAEKEGVLAAVQDEYLALMRDVPNLTHPNTPIGGEEDYRVLEKNREPTLFDFPPLDHEALLTNLGLLDFDRGAKVAGSKFYFSKGDLVRLNDALIHYGIDRAAAHGYELVETPDLAQQQILLDAGFNPRGPEKQIYNIEETNLSLIGTAEIAMLGYHTNEILDFSYGPKKYVALSHCFRVEGGAYGRTSKGLYRVHQFTKLEMFVFCLPDQSEAMHHELLSIEKEIVDGLDIPYRVIDIPSGDLGGPAYRKFDIEAWMTMKGDKNKQGDYGEITSTSNCTEYQARRANIKYRATDGSLQYVHTLNGTAVVASRFPIAVVENHQQADGSIRIPDVLQKYMGKSVITARR